MEDNAFQDGERGRIFISEADAAEIQVQIENGGIINVTEFLHRKLAEWKKQPLNVAIIGDSGTGKSSFINAIRQKTADDEGAAPVGLTQCTTEPTPYNHPTNNDLIFWDLPGVGTPDYPKGETYLEKIDYKKYDFFLIFSALRFTENYLWLAEMVRKRERKFFFVRTMIDSALSNHKKSHPSTFQESQALTEMRNKIIIELEKKGFRNPHVLLISNFHPRKWDFAELCKLLVQSLPDLKKEAMVLTLDAFSKDMIKTKRNILESRIWKIALLSAAGNAIPIPRVPYEFDIEILMREISFYKSQLCLDDESLSRLSIKMNRGHDYLKEHINASTMKLASREGIINLIASYGSIITARDIASYIRLIPEICILVSALSFVATYKMLYDVLGKLEEEAYIVLQVFNRDSLNDIEEDELD